MTQLPLTKDLIPEPSLWRLSLMLCADSIEVIAYSTVEDSSLICATISLDKAAPSYAAAVEEAIYANPMLLLPFGHCDVVVRTPRFTILPLSLAPVAEDACSMLWHDSDNTVFTSPLDDTLIAAASIPSEVANFIGRTFFNTTLVHHISPLVRYFSHKSRLGNSGKMYLHLRKSNADLIVFGTSGVTAAVSVNCPSASDAVYRTLAVARRAGFDPEADELYLCGDTQRRSELMPMLRRYINYVMPVIFPSAMFRAGREALNAPFELIALPLCE